MVRGRPVFSEVRQNMIEILALMKRAYAYDLYKHYREIFAPVTMRLIYYHMRKGVDLEEFKIDKVEQEHGDFSWGTVVQKTYYKIGPKANVKGDPRVKKHFDKKKGKKKVIKKKK